MKRDRDGSYVRPITAVKPLLVDLEKWRDACGVPFKLSSQLSTPDPSHVVLEVGRFDELLCRNVMGVTHAQLKGGYHIRDLHFNLHLGKLTFFISRDASAVQAPPSDKLDDEVALSLRAKHRLPEDDVEAVLKALAAVGGKIASLSSRPKHYELLLEFNGGNVTMHSIAAAVQYAGLLDRVQGLVVLNIPKHAADID